tara:strand:- start:11337 stop:11591 length:255 start_codon:yes stop_codon:yes gene_type:complete
MSKFFYDKSKATEEPLFKFWSFAKINYIIFGIGLIFIIAGYIVMAQGPENVDSFSSLYLAPIILFLGYIIIIPFSLIYKPKSKE